jgi:hypothetical protein
MAKSRQSAALCVLIAAPKKRTTADSSATRIRSEYTGRRHPVLLRLRGAISTPLVALASGVFHCRKRGLPCSRPSEAGYPQLVRPAVGVIGNDLVVAASIVGAIDQHELARQLAARTDSGPAPWSYVPPQRAETDRSCHGRRTAIFSLNSEQVLRTSAVISIQFSI